MQNVTLNYAGASSGAGGVWADPRLSVDWMQDGYDVTAYFGDRFQRNLLDQWGTPDVGGTGALWVNSVGPATAFDVVYDGGALETSGYGSHTVLEADDGFFKTRNSVLSSPLVYVAEITVKLQLPTPTGGAVESLVFFRYVDGPNHYRAGVVVNPGGGVNLAIVRSVDSVETGLFGADSGIVYTGPTNVLVYRCRMLADATIQLSAWIDGQVPPVDWQATVVDPAPILLSGMVGVHTTSYPGNTNTRPLIIKYTDIQVINGLPDDISPQAGSWSVTHFLDDGFPDSVAFIAGIGTPTLAVDIGAPPAYLTDDVPQTSAEYYSPYNTHSPIFGRDRDVPPVKLEHGVITSAGPERVTVFTGQMGDIPVKRGKATLTALSATRLDLAKLVQPPAVNGAYQGANATWPISYALSACGVYPSPPPQDGCRWWAPMHGSSRSFIPSENIDVTDSFVNVDGNTGPTKPGPVRTLSGPYVANLDNGVNPDHFQRVFTPSTATAGLHLADGHDIAAEDSVVKLEMWVKGDAVFLNFAPGGSASVTYELVQFLVDMSTSPFPSIKAQIRKSDRKLVCILNDGGGTIITATSTSALPSDGAWHFCGWAWDMDNQKAFVNLDGTVNTATDITFASGIFFGDAFFATNRPAVSFLLPVSEVQLTAGTTGSAVSPDVGPWLRTIPFTARATVDLSVMELANVAEPTAREAWELLGSYAQAELASMRTDELDIFRYLTSGHWVEAAQQVVAETYSTEYNSDTVDINIDPTKIANEILISFNEVLSPNSFVSVFSSAEAVQLKPGITVLSLPLSLAAYELRGFTFTNVAAADTVQPLNINSVSFNGSPDGAGLYYSADYITATVLSWDPGEVIVQISNTSGITLYLANDKNWPSLTVAAKSQDENQASIIERDEMSIAVRGERSLSVPSSRALQTRVNARRLARRLLMALRNPQPTAEALNLFGEARRQPGDLVIFEDPSMTRVSGLWRSQSVGHDHKVSGDAVDYENTVIVRPTRDILIIGEGIIGDTLIGPKQ